MTEPTKRTTTELDPEWPKIPIRPSKSQEAAREALETFKWVCDQLLDPSTAKAWGEAMFGERGK